MAPTTRATAQPTADTDSTHASEPLRPSVLFVCLGNICRSPMAEGVFRHLLSTTKSHGSPALLATAFGTIDSAGTGAYHALSPPDSRTSSVLAAHGITEYTHAARKVRAADFVDFAWIFAMDRDNLEDLRELRARVVRGRKRGEDGVARVVLFGEFGGKGHEEVVDPYYGGRDGFETAYEQVERFSKGFLKHLDDSWKATSQ